MTREEQIDWLCRLRADLNNGVIFTPWNKEFTEALNDVLEQEPTTKNDLGVDCISRQAVIEEMEKRHAEGDYITKGFINSLPPVTPIRPKGHWIPVYQGDEIINYRCSECEFGNTFGKGTIGMNFCTHCGADMREVLEE